MSADAVVIGNENDPKVIPQRESKSMRSIEKLSELLDSKFTIPGTKIKFGLDPIISIVPVLGDGLSLTISGLLIFTMHRHGASKKLVAKMSVNALIDAVVGSIPILGTLFDFYFKANDRNVKLLKEYYYEGKHGGSAKTVVFLTLTLILLVLAGLFLLAFKIIASAWELITA